MKTFKMAFTVLCVAGVLIGLTSAVWAGGAGGVYGCCVADNPGGGAIALKGTIAVVYDPGAYNSDVKLRLARGGTFGFFQLNLTGNPHGLDNFEWACFVLNPNEPPPAEADAVANENAVTGLVNSILKKFFPDSGMNSTNTRLVITRSSIDLSDGNSGEKIDDTGRRAAMGDIIVYVADPAKVNLEENANCIE